MQKHERPYNRPETIPHGGIVFALLLVFALSFLAPGIGAATLTGRALDQESGAPLINATVHLLELNRISETDSSGHFDFDNIPDGTYTLRITHVGYRPIRRTVDFTGQDYSGTTFRLASRPVVLPGITVRPGFEYLSPPTRLGSATLSPDQLRSTPQFGEDIYRAATRLPGVTGNDLSSRFIVRGGEHDQVLVTLDGMELEEPFHMKDVDGGVISIIDVSAIREVNLATGGFSAEYGDRLSGVFDLKTRDVYAADPNYGVSISLTNMRANAEGSFGRGRGSWLGSARRGYVDLVTDFDGEFEELSPRYYDAFGKVSFRLSTVHDLAGYILHAHDNLRFAEDFDDRSHMIHNDTYGWFTLTSRWAPSLSTTTLLSAGGLDHHRSGEDLRADTAPFRYRVNDRRDYRFAGIKQDFRYAPFASLLLKSGWELKTLTAEYDYRKEWLNYTYMSSGSLAWYQSQIDSTDTDLTISGRRTAAYLSAQVTPVAPLTVETGLRYAANTYAGDNILSPRLSADLRMTSRTTLRLAWGRYAQSQKIYDLAIPDSDPTFYPAEHAEHRVIGLLHRFPGAVEFRVEAYDKLLTDIRPEYYNWLESVYLFPEASDDRVQLHRSSARSRGIEFYLARTSEHALTWRLSYALAKVTEQVTGYLDDGVWLAVNEEVPGAYDQRHSFMVDLAWQPAPDWSVAAAWQYRSGWPFTAAEVTELGTFQYVMAGDLNGERYDSYTRLDLRIGRDFSVGTGDLRLFLEIMNVLNQTNTRVYEYNIDCSNPDGCKVQRTGHDWLGILPSIGISWRFGN